MLLIWLFHSHRERTDYPKKKNTLEIETGILQDLFIQLLLREVVLGRTGILLSGLATSLKKKSFGGDDDGVRLTTLDWDIRDMAALARFAVHRTGLHFTRFR